MSSADYYTFVQPTLTANGVLGGPSFAVYSNSVYNSDREAFKAFNRVPNNSYNSVVSSSLSTPAYLIMYNPEPLNVTRINLQHASGCWFKTGNIHASDDNIHWSNIWSGGTDTLDSQIDLSTYVYAKYWKIECTQAKYVNGGDWAVHSVELTATYKHSFDTYADHVTTRHLIKY